MPHRRSLYTILWLSVSLCAFAVGDEKDVYIEQLVRGDPASIKSVSQHMVQIGFRDRAVLDVLAEVVSEKAFTASFHEVDAISWGCRALGASRDARYRRTLTRIYRSRANAKIRKYARIALDQVGRGTEEYYEPGTIDLRALREGRRPSPSTPKPEFGKPRPTPEPGPEEPMEPKKYEPISAATHGMSMQEVFKLVGPPTSTTSRVTGKGFVPFYQGGDTSRTIALYEGQGRIIFGRRSRYDSTLRVLQVEYNEAEIGYP